MFKTPPFIIIGSILLATFLIGGVIVALNLAGRSAYHDQFKDVIDGYLAITKLQMAGGAYTKGKVIVIDTRDKKVDEEILAAFPAPVRAENPAEVDTVVLVKWTVDVVGIYFGPNNTQTSAMVHRCDVTIIDQSIPAIVGHQNFRGGDPPVSTTGRGDAYGTKPVKEIMAYVAGLPRVDKVPPPETGPPPKGWIVLFRSDDPADWNTQRAGANFAIPIAQAHKAIRYLRLKRMDTGAYLVLPITHKQLLEDKRPDGAATPWWNGTARAGWGARHLGIAQPPADPAQGVIALVNDQGVFRGSGFGWKTYVDDKQYFTWQGEEIPKTAFEIAVTADPLTQAEEAFRPIAVALFVPPRPVIPPGTPVPNALAQPEPPPIANGKKALDLLPLIDQGKDVVTGQWLVVKNALHCNDQGGVPRMQIPYQPPEEYDFMVTFSQPRLRNGISLIMPNPNGGSFFWAVGFNGGFRSALHGLKDNPLSPALAVNKAYTATVEVRRTGVRALLDSKVLAEHKTNFRDLTCDEYRDIPNKKCLAVACDDPTVFHYIQVVEITGPGKKTR